MLNHYPVHTAPPPPLSRALSLSPPPSLPPSLPYFFAASFSSRTILYRYGGDVYKFAGDALIIVWTASGPFEDYDLTKLCLKALKCGMALKVPLMPLSANLDWY
jgi:hypothetical protein